MAENAPIVGYDGKCPLCGSFDGTIVRESDGKFRNICRVMGCPAFYRPAPFEGHSSIDDVRNPEASELIKNGDCTIGRYLNGVQSAEASEE